MDNNNKKNEKGVTFVEVMISMAIIGILASIATVNLMEARKKTKASSVLQSFSAVTSSAYRCIIKAKDTTDGRLTNPASVSLMCSGTGISSSEFPSWPDISNANWGYAGGKFVWCTVGYSGSSHPSAFWAAGAYDDSLGHGGSRATSKFCYMLCDEDCGSSAVKKWIWCTESGCAKEGF